MSDLVTPHTGALAQSSSEYTPAVIPEGSGDTRAGILPAMDRAELTKAIQQGLLLAAREAREKAEVPALWIQVAGAALIVVAFLAELIPGLADLESQKFVAAVIVGGLLLLSGPVLLLLASLRKPTSEEQEQAVEVAVEKARENSQREPRLKQPAPTPAAQS